MNNISMIFNASELALAAYANLTPGVTDNPIRQAALVAAGLSAKQAEEFAKKYPEILTQYTDTPAEGGLGTSFSATVFKDTTGNLTLAIRGTAELVGTPNDILPSDTDIALAGASFDQIVALWNWWQRVSHAADTLVPQYHFAVTPTNPGQAVFIQSSLGQWLEPIASVAATGTLVAALGADSDYQLDVTGHSLGGGLASLMAVFFDRPATVFDEAPFEMSADSKDIVDELMERLAEYAIRHKAQGRGVRPMV